MLLPIGRETDYTWDKEGYASWLRPVWLSDDGGSHSSVMPEAQGIAGAHAGLGSPYPMRGTGSISLGVNIAGATFRGIGGFTEVTPGTVRVYLGGEADRCAVEVGWPSSEPNSLRMPIRDGCVTGSVALCPQTP